MNLFLKLSYLNSYFVLTLGYLYPALNNPAWKDKCCMLICFTALVFSLQLITFHDPRPTQSSCNPVGVCSFFKGGGGLCWVGFDRQLLYMKTLSSSEFFGEATTPLLVSQDQITRIQVNFSQQKCYDFFWIEQLVLNEQ